MGVERQRCGKRDEHGRLLTQRMSMRDDRGLSSMRGDALHIVGAEQPDDGRAHGATVAEGAIAKDAGVGSPPVNAIAHQLENARGAAAVPS